MHVQSCRLLNKPIAFLPFSLPSPLFELAIKELTQILEKEQETLTRVSNRVIADRLIHVLETRHKTKYTRTREIWERGCDTATSVPSRQGHFLCSLCIDPSLLFPRHKRERAVFAGHFLCGCFTSA